MFRVTSETSTTAASHAARPKSTAPSQSSTGTSFSALVDSNSDAAADNRPPATDPSPQQPLASSQSQKPLPANKPDRSADTSSDAQSNAPANPDAPDSTTAPAAGTVIVSKDGKIVVAPKPTGKDGEQTSDGTGTDEATSASAAQPTGPVAVVIPVMPTPATTATTDDPAAAGTTAAAGDAAAAAAAAATAAAAAATTGPGTADGAFAEAAAAAQAATATETNPTGEPIKTPGKAILTPRLATTAATTADAGVSAQPAGAPQGTDATNPGSAAQKPTAEAVAKKDQAAVDAAKSDATAKDGTTDPAPATTSGHHLQALSVDALSLASDSKGAAAALQIQPQTQASATTAATQLTATLATPAAVPLAGVAMEISAQAQIGRSRFEIRLDPPELGRIDVRLDVDHRGQVTSHLTVDKVETLDLLRRDAPQLQRALEDAGLKTGDNGLQFSLRDQSSSQGRDDGNSGRNSQRLIISEDDTVPTEIAGRSYGRMLGASRGVDIRV